MRDNIYESLRIRELTDKKLASNLVQKEARRNNQDFIPSASKALNIYESPTKTIGQHHLVSMHKAGSPKN